MLWLLLETAKKNSEQPQRLFSGELERISQRIQKIFPDKFADKEVLYESEAKIPRIEELNAESNAGYGDLILITSFHELI